MTTNKSTLVVPVLLITLGIGWLLTALGIGPGIDWAWTLGVALVGVLTFALGGIDKVTIVMGPFFILASSLSLLRQMDRLRIDTEVPILVIAAGALLLVARMKSIPAPSWLERSRPR